MGEIQESGEQPVAASYFGKSSTSFVENVFLERDVRERQGASGRSVSSVEGREYLLRDVGRKTPRGKKIV